MNFFQLPEAPCVRLNFASVRSHRLFTIRFAELFKEGRVWLPRCGTQVLCLERLVTLFMFCCHSLDVMILAQRALHFLG